MENKVDEVISVELPAPPAWKKLVSFSLSHSLTHTENYLYVFYFGFRACTISMYYSIPLVLCNGSFFWGLSLYVCLAVCVWVVGITFLLRGEFCNMGLHNLFDFFSASNNMW